MAKKRRSKKKDNDPLLIIAVVAVIVVVLAVLSGRTENILPAMQGKEPMMCAQMQGNQVTGYSRGECMRLRDLSDRCNDVAKVIVVTQGQYDGEGFTARTVCEVQPGLVQYFSNEIN